MIGIWTMEFIPMDSTEANEEQARPCQFTGPERRQKDGPFIIIIMIYA
jgi:hypothetical protein